MNVYVGKLACIFQSVQSQPCDLHQVDRVPGICYVAVSQSLPLALERSYVYMDRPTCEDITLFKVFSLKLKTSWSDDINVTKIACYLDRMTSLLTSIQVSITNSWP